MVYRRDPLSVQFDDIAFNLVVRAIRAGRRRQGIRVWIASPSSEFRKLDAGGLTVHERAFKRSCYYLVGPNRQHTPEYGKPPSIYSLKMAVTAGPVPSQRGWRARQFRLRIWPRDQARRTSPSWTSNDELRSGAGDLDRFSA